MPAIPFLELKVLEKIGDMGFQALGHKKTDNQS